MSTNKPDSDNRENRRRRRRKSGKKNDNRGKSFVPRQFDTQVCEICREPIKDVTASMSLDGESDKTSHFDCILKDLSQKENLPEDEKIIYLGSGSFGVVKKDEYARRQLSILRKIQYARPEEREEWRKKMREPMEG